jgi:hypothetical protein
MRRLTCASTRASTCASTCARTVGVTCSVEFRVGPSYVVVIMQRTLKYRPFFTIKAMFLVSK